MKLPETQYAVLAHLIELSEGQQKDTQHICDDMGLDQVHVSVAAQILSDAGLIAVDEQSYVELQLGKVGRTYAEAGFPERLAIKGMETLGGSARIADLANVDGLDKRAVGESIKHLSKKGWASKDRGNLALTDAGHAALDGLGPDELLVNALAAQTAVQTAKFYEAELPLTDALTLLKGRRDVVVEKRRVKRHLSVTPLARERWAEGITPLIQVSQLTSDLLVGGKWRDVELKPYDVALSVTPEFGGKSHPFRRVLDETRDVFLQMGFSEIESPHTESGFWDFDALFQPQDHPAREMQDTFYLSNPAETKLPDPSLVEQIKATHETGGTSGSIGWQYKWDVEKAKQAVLRTHTTAATIRSLAANPHAPQKKFCVGRVFRREAIDYKHLPVFYQVDGIIVDKDASFADLLGTLSAFYRKMGFEKFDFRPAFFPYTEPSVEIFVWLEKRKDWVEMGGAGIFRPEVTKPLGCDVPVLAWGLGLERLAMFRFDLDDIRKIYQSDIQWLREVPLCR